MSPLTDKTNLTSRLKRSGVIALALFALLSTPCAMSQVVIHPLPEGEPLSPHFKVSVNGVNAPVGITKVTGLKPVERRSVLGTRPADAYFASFDMGSQPVKVVVSANEKVEDVRILPSSYGIKPEVNGQQISFTVAHPGQLTVEVNGNWMNSLHIFANPPETDVPDPRSNKVMVVRPGTLTRDNLVTLRARNPEANIIYFEPGRHEVEEIAFKDGETIYIPAGAIVYTLQTESRQRGGYSLNFVGDNLTLRGRGIIDGSPTKQWHRHMMQLNGNNMKVEGVILRDSPTWCLVVNNSGNVQIDNVKVIGWRHNSDGIDIVGSHDVDVTNSFIRTYDDLVVVKTSHRSKTPARNIRVSRCILWNELAHALSVGAETPYDISDVHFFDCDVIRDKGRETVLRVYHADAGHVSNILFENIRIEEAYRIMGAAIVRTQWTTKDAELGVAENITFRDIDAHTEFKEIPVAFLRGYDKDKKIKNIRFENVRVGNQPIQPYEVMRNGYTEGISITP